MLVSPRTYKQSQAEAKDESILGTFGPKETLGWGVAPEVVRAQEKMLLVHQQGNVRVGEVVRYTLTYTPSHDRILPAPSHLHVKIRNTSAIPLRAAYLHGPYTLYAACYPTTFDPNHNDDGHEEDGHPQFEPNLKAGGSWMSRLTVPERIRNSEDKFGLLQGQQDHPTTSAPSSATWVIEISSQIIFSLSAAVHFELLISRDEKSLELGFATLMGQAPATPGQLEDHQQSKRKISQNAAQPKGIYSHAVKIIVEDTAALWDKPALPKWKGDEDYKPGSRGLVNGDATAGKVDVGPGKEKSSQEEEQKPQKKKKRVHLVVLTHGLHSNLSSDMLYLKESIDATAKKTREEKRKKREESQKAVADSKLPESTSEDKKSTSQQPPPEPKTGGEVDDGDEDEEVIVRGFPGNACRTERGIQYLGKRLAKWILETTYPDQPFLPAKKSLRKKMSRVLTGESPSDFKGTPEHKGSTIYKPAAKQPNLPYKITSISFVAHSLGGLTQAYAIAYIHKHSPHFFDEIKPINFIAMAAPFLGLSNENPLYVKFALDFGLVGRTGQDLGLAWKSSTALRGGWDSMIAGIGTEGQRAQKQPDPGSKPLLRILPAGHTHQVLKKFRNRTVYSNVVNDGIVPLRTSCLLFLDWSGLGRVEKARRDNGLVSGLASWGWAEMTGANASSRHLRAEVDSDAWSQSNASGDGTLSRNRSRSRSRSRQPTPSRVPEPDDSAVGDNDKPESPKDSQFLSGHRIEEDSDSHQAVGPPPQQQPAHPITSFLSLFKPASSKKDYHSSPKQTKVYKRSQTTKLNAGGSSPPEGLSSAESSRRPGNIRGNSMLDDPSNVFAPPKTTIFESAGDVLNPPLPTQQFLTDPRSRPRTIFHDRVYHPDEIPAPRAKKPPRLKRSISNESGNGQSRASTLHGDDSDSQDTGGMKVEEKIARAYHHGLSWRKVLVRLEPDAHNNMVVRRMFSNAYGWPVIKHLVDTHFADTYEATTEDTDEPSVERAKPTNEAVGSDGEERQDLQSPDIRRTDSEIKEASDLVPEMNNKSGGSRNSRKASRNDSIISSWDDAIFEGSDDDSDNDSPTVSGPHGRNFTPQSQSTTEDDGPKGTSETEISAFLGKPKPILDTSAQQGGPSQFVASPQSTTSLGLGKSIEEQLNHAQKTDLPKSENDEREQDLSELQVENGH
ncbi:uncharacterized protein KY384_005615 [Bacidia gigantensis]|uniref:uncharacterized protein n=1 Tax=Bacidia gigantensis TaxID=2732470 RepID=UPI001D03A0D2|nr:uncharacterized protein KY384_005615 [Bacidia gigantensis]KAG8530132.1 hypothetical protein KY384_005615 [Bacidia gigantensis]